ncbi:hypothetical protein JQC92_02345 [Shewanella sp. 202IG2-18]|uniref:hypothetical protein n=1 Tax=Parashewanella hymeniacidonis TaxID=2807618 RepID=UPI00195F59AB|nr:hypothetical protein [Parashewanella hymeniacidonis]MBM7070881.1 hypothetical protein [Parashewanella hymeniacidonis]
MGIKAILTVLLGALSALFYGQPTIPANGVVTPVNTRRKEKNRNGIDFKYVDCGFVSLRLRKPYQFPNR